LFSDTWQYDVQGSSGGAGGGDDPRSFSWEAKGKAVAQQSQKKKKKKLPRGHPDDQVLTFLVNSEPACVLFNSEALHAFITLIVVKHNLPMCFMKQSLLVSSPDKELKASHLCPRVSTNIMGVEFLANLIVLKFSSIDVILGMNWLAGCDGSIQCRKRSVLLTSPQGDEVEFVAAALLYPRE
jgi:hypothetical protein